MGNWIIYLLILAVLSQVLKGRSPREKRPRRRPVQPKMRAPEQTGTVRSARAETSQKWKRVRSEPKESVPEEVAEPIEEHGFGKGRDEELLFPGKIGANEVLLGVVMKEVLSSPRARRPYRYR